MLDFIVQYMYLARQRLFHFCMLDSATHYIGVAGQYHVIFLQTVFVKRLYVIALCFLPLGAWAKANYTPFAKDVPPIHNLNSKIYVLMDANSGDLLIGKDINKQYPPASLTKIMTSIVVSSYVQQGTVRLEDKALISKKAWKRGGSRMFLHEGTRVTINELMHGLIIQSGNDAAIALSEYIAGSESDFVVLMNGFAQQLGLHDTHFVNSTGWPDDAHFSTALDMAKLTRVLILDYPERYTLHAKKHYTYNNIRQPNRNSLLWEDDSVDGVKTGYTDGAQYNMIVSAERGGMRLIAVVMGAASKRVRARDGLRLLNYGFRYFETQLLYKKDQIVHQVPVWKSKQELLDLIVQEPIYVTMPKATNQSLTAKVEVPAYNSAPIAAFSQVGTLQIVVPSRADSLIVPLIVAYEAQPAGFFSRLLDSIQLFFMSLFGADASDGTVTESITRPSV